MSKYKVGDKVVLTVTSTNEMGCLPCYVLNDDLILSKQDIDKYAEPLTAYTEPLEAKIRRQAADITRLLAENKKLKAENGNSLWNIEQARAEGAETAWELARKIFSMEIKDIEDIFIETGAWNLGTVLDNNTYHEAAAKVAEWEKAKEEIKVGDIVRLQEGSGNDLCILCKTSDEKYYNAVDKYGALYPLLQKEHFSKTGRHIDVDSFLKQIGG